MDSTSRDLRLSQGFSAGNYCNSYETQDFGEAFVKRYLDGSGIEFSTAFILGFFASYELHEIPFTDRDMFDEAYHSNLGQRVLELGYTDRRDASYAAEQDSGECSD